MDPAKVDLAKEYPAEVDRPKWTGRSGSGQRRIWPNGSGQSGPCQSGPGQMDLAKVDLAEVDLAKEDKVKVELAKWIWPKRTKSKLEYTCAP